MSLVTIIENKDIITNKIDNIRSLNYESTYELCGYVLSECLMKQYEMMRKNLNKNSVSKRFYSQELNGKNLLNAYYQHMYMHNHIALEDEIYEIIEAIEKYNYINMHEQDLTTNEFNEKFFRRKMLILEEIIDAFHFILEYTDIIEEHYRLQLTYNTMYNTDMLMRSVTEESKLESDIMYMIQNEGPHIITWLESRQFSTKLDQTIKEYPWQERNDLHIKSLHRFNRDFIRKINFKDWKNYPEDFYSPSKFGELNEINRMMFSELFMLFENNMDFLYDLIPNCKSRSGVMCDIFTNMYGIYMAKREENIRRQNNDPRYTGKTTGEVVGVKA